MIFAARELFPLNRRHGTAVGWPVRCLAEALFNLAHSSPRCEGLFPPTTRTILHQPHSKPTLPGSAFFCARFCPSRCVRRSSCWVFRSRRPKRAGSFHAATSCAFSRRRSRGERLL